MSSKRNSEVVDLSTGKQKSEVVDLSTGKRKSGVVDLSAGRRKSGVVDLSTGEQKSGVVDLSTGKRKSGVVDLTTGKRKSEVVDLTTGKRKSEVVDLTYKDEKIKKLVDFMSKQGYFKMVYKKWKDKVFQSNDSRVFVKFVFKDKIEPTEEIDQLTRVQTNPSQFLMNIMYNDMLINSTNSFYHVIGTANCGYMSNGRTKWSDQEFLVCFHDLSSGLLHLNNEIGLCHRDIHKTNYVRNKKTGRWVLIDFDNAESVNYNGKSSFLVHRSFKSEHHPALLLSASTDKSDFTTSRLLNAKYANDKKNILRLLDMYQLWISILVSSSIVKETSLPLLVETISPVHTCSDELTPDCISSALQAKMMLLICKTENAFRISQDEKAPKYDEFYELTTDFLLKISSILRTDPLLPLTANDTYDAYSDMSLYTSDEKFVDEIKNVAPPPRRKYMKTSKHICIM